MRGHLKDLKTKLTCEDKGLEGIQGSAGLAGYESHSISFSDFSGTTNYITTTGTGYTVSGGTDPATGQGWWRDSNSYQNGGMKRRTAKFIITSIIDVFALGQGRSSLEDEIAEAVCADKRADVMKMMYNFNNSLSRIEVLYDKKDSSKLPDLNYPGGETPVEYDRTTSIVSAVGRRLMNEESVGHYLNITIGGAERKQVHTVYDNIQNMLKYCASTNKGDQEIGKALIVEMVLNGF